jgi:Mg-chelatase subunit ChlD
MMNGVTRVTWLAVAPLALAACADCAKTRLPPRAASDYDDGPPQVTPGQSSSDEPTRWDNVTLGTPRQEFRDPADEVHACKRLAVAFVVDHSRVMEGQLEVVKGAVCAAVDRLSRNDCVTVVAFDTRSNRVVGLQVVNEPATIKEKVDLLRIGEGTELRHAMVMATAIDTGFWELLNARRAQRHIIVYSDGFNDGVYWSGDLRDPTVVTTSSPSARRDADRVTVSAVALPGKGKHDALRSLARTYGGNFYEVTDNSSLLKASRAALDFALSDATDLRRW